CFTPLLAKTAKFQYSSTIVPQFCQDVNRAFGKKSKLLQPLSHQKTNGAHDFVIKSLNRAQSWGVDCAISSVCWQNCELKQVFAQKFGVQTQRC
ncbi:MAG: hypothetical protein IJB95_05720, partial [Clostridia bacterium]|nr:hypothetical protein [Clostridia bacterium]